ncbi:MAG: ACP S-malonyltransferase [Phycisphaerae bacterium]|nr:ACP S-malonyltransferase [Phycisphaerae bacterium]NUQ47392.1 ACP S-malonyltransferase [Phycisphaerae bacterium]
MGRTAVIFPGQGAQVVGMGRDFVERSAAARRTFEDANRILGFDLADLCFSGPAERLNATDISQPAIFVTSVAVWSAIQEDSALAAEIRPDASAGLSLGEYTALWLAEALSFEDALRLVNRRGQLMQRAAEARPGGMVSVMGLNSDQIDQVVHEAACNDVLVASNFNAPGQTVLSGDQVACERVPPIVERLGGRAAALRVAGAFHSPLMQSAAEELKTALAATTVNAPRIPVAANVTGDYHEDPERIRALLYTQVARPIHWHASIERLIRDGIERFVEVGPGRVLTGLMRSIDRSVQAVNISTAQAMDKFRTAGAAAKGSD